MITPVCVIIMPHMFSGFGFVVLFVCLSFAELVFVLDDACTDPMYGPNSTPPHKSDHEALYDCGHGARRSLPQANPIRMLVIFCLCS